MKVGTVCAGMAAARAWLELALYIGNAAVVEAPGPMGFKSNPGADDGGGFSGTAPGNRGRGG
jgi:hypothetical protein